MTTQKRCVFYLTLLKRIGGEPKGNRKAWLNLIAKRSGVSFRVVFGAFYHAELSRPAQQKLEEAAERYELENYAAQFELVAESLRTKDENFFEPQIDHLRALASQMRLRNRSGGE